MKVSLIVDSGCDITKSEADKENIIFLPLKTLFGDKEYLDGVTITHKEFYEKLIEGDETPTTSQVAPYEFEEAYREALQKSDEVVVITISGKLSGTYQSASIAKENYEDSIFLVDSENVCIGTQILVRFAMELREKGLDAKTIVSELEKKKKDVCVIALLDTLEYLKRGGRISKTSAFAGEMLSLKPVIAVVDGEVVSLGNARGSKKGNNMLTQLISEKGGIDFKKPYALGYAGLSDALLQKYIEDSASIWKEQTDKLPISTIGSTIGTHVGPGAIAVAFFHL